MTQEDLSDMFGEFGVVENVRIQTHADGRPRGFAHITFASKESAVAAVTSAREEPLHVSGRDLVIDYARQAAATYSKVEPSNKMYFSRFLEDESELRTFLDEWKDSIVSVYFMRDGNTGEKLPSGFVEFKDVATTTEVIDKMNNKQLEDGETLRLSYARARKSTPGGERGRYPPRQERGPKRAHYTSREYRSERSEGSYGGGRGGGGGGGDRWN
jgi:RNA recognition motif-containing protein